MPKKIDPKMSKRVFYRTVFRVEVLSEEPLPRMELKDIAFQIEEGGCSGTCVQTEERKLDGLQAAKNLLHQRSDPSFLRLTNNGHDTDEE